MILVSTERCTIMLKKPMYLPNKLCQEVGMDRHIQIEKAVILASGYGRRMRRKNITFKAYDVN